MSAKNRSEEKTEKEINVAEESPSNNKYRARLYYEILKALLKFVERKTQHSKQQNENAKS